MKKIIILLIIASMLLTCVTACSGSKKSELTQTSAPESTFAPTSDVTDLPITLTVYDLLNDLSKKDYSGVEIDIAITTDFAKLCSNYVLTQGKVAYSIERLNLLSLKENVIDLPERYKTTVTGYALIENGQLVELDGNKDVTLPSYDELKGNFNFNESNFKNAVISTNSFEGDVVVPSQFYGADLEMSNLKVKVEYTETSLTKIIISYDTANAAVQTVYAFGN